MMPKLIAKPNVPLPIRNALPARYCPPCRGRHQRVFLDLRGVGQVVIRQEAAGPVRQMVEDACHHFRELGVVLLKLRINHVQLNGSRRGSSTCTSFSSYC